MNHQGGRRSFLLRLRMALHWRMLRLCNSLAPPQGEKLVQIQAENVFFDIAKYVTEATSSELQASTISQAKRCLIDGLACICAGASTSEGKSLMKQILHNL